MLTNGNDTAGLVLDFGIELQGGLRLGVSSLSSKKMKMRVRFGESVSEAMSELGEKGACNDHAIRDSVIDLPRSTSTATGLISKTGTSGGCRAGVCRDGAGVRPRCLFGETGAWRCLVIPVLPVVCGVARAGRRALRTVWRGAVFGRCVRR